MKQEKIISIRTKLLGIILPVVVIIVAVLVGISYVISRTTIEEDSENLLNTSVENQVNQIEAWLEENLSAFGAVKQSIETMGLSDTQLQQLLDGYYGYNGNYPQGLYVADADGKMMTASESSKTESNPTQTVWYQEGMTRINMGFTGAYTNADGEAVISACGILNDHSGRLKVISADLSLQRISIIVSSLVSMEQAQAFLVNSNDHTILAHRDSSLLSTKLDESQDVFLRDVGQKLADGDLGTIQIDGNMAAFAEVAGTDWILVSYIPSKVIYRDVDNIRTAMILIGIVSILLLALLIGRVVYVVIRPVKGLTKAIMAMTEGDFTVRIQTRSRDEIGVMGRCMEKYADTMRSMIASIHGVSGRLQEQADASNDVSGQMYDASKMQSTSMQELNETVEQLSISVNEIAENATTLAMVVADTRENSVQVNQKMQETVDVSQKGKADMQNVSSAMQDINESVMKLQEAIDKVGQASEEITNITNVIGNIADETNLLSLNASIEAARAGEAGKGFAVVAGEIGNLAGSSSSMATEIQNICNKTKENISQIQTCFDNIVMFLQSDIQTQFGDFVKATNEYYTSIEEIQGIIKDIEQSANVFVDVVSNIKTQIRDMQNVPDGDVVSIEEVTDKVGQIKKMTEELSVAVNVNCDNAVSIREIGSRFSEY